MESIWTDTAALPAFPMLEGHLQADVAVIGGGLAGILTAHLLRQEGVNVILLEANQIGSGQTGGTTAKLTAQHGLNYHQLMQTLGPGTAGQYARANLDAVERLRQLVQEWNIDCDFQDCTSFLYATESPKLLQEEYNACSKLGMDVFLTSNTELPFPVQALGLRNQAMFHPLKLLAALTDGLHIYEHSRVLEAAVIRCAPITARLQSETSSLPATILSSMFRASILSASIRSAAMFWHWKMRERYRTTIWAWMPTPFLSVPAEAICCWEEVDTAPVKIHRGRSIRT